MSSPASVGASLDVAHEVSLARFKQSLLGIVHERDLAEERCTSLDCRLREAQEACKAADLVATDLRSRLDDSLRAQEEADQRSIAHRKASEDERVRHALAMRLAKQKEHAQHLLSGL